MKIFFFLFVTSSLSLINSAHAANSSALASCGQKGTQFQKQINKSKDSHFSYCDNNKAKQNLLPLAQACKAEDGSQDLIALAEQQASSIDQYCNQTKQILDNAKEACTNNQKTSELTDKFLADAKAYRDNQFATTEDMIKGLGAEKENIQAQLRSTDGILSKSKPKREQASPLADQLRKIPDSQVMAISALDKKRVKDIRTKERAWDNCEDRYESYRCQPQKADYKQALAKRKINLQKCQELAKAQQDLAKLQKNLDEKFKELGKSVESLKKENAEKLAAAEKQNFDEYLKKLDGGNLADKQIADDKERSEALKALKNDRKLTGSAREEKFKEILEPYSKKTAAMLLRNNGIDETNPDYDKKLDTASKAVMAQWAHETGLCSASSQCDRLNLAGLGGGNPRRYDSLDAFVTNPGNPNGSIGGSNNPGYVSYITRQNNIGWTGYNDAATSLSQGNVTDFYNRLGNGGFCSPSHCPPGSYAAANRSMNNRLWGASGASSMYMIADALEAKEKAKANAAQPVVSSDSTISDPTIAMMNQPKLLPTMNVSLDGPITGSPGGLFAGSDFRQDFLSLNAQ